MIEMYGIAPGVSAMAVLELEAQPAFLDVALQLKAAARNFALAIAWPREIVAYGGVATPFP